MSFLKLAGRRLTTKDGPSSASVQNTKDRGVFGRDLQSLLDEQNRVVPIVVQQCTDWLEKNALLEEGLFRIPGSSTHIQRLVYLYNKDATAEMDFSAALNGEPVSPHTLAGLLKVFFRELPQPVLTYRLYATFLKVQQNANHEVRLKNLRMLIQGLPKQHRNLLLHLMKFLGKVAEKSDFNKMTPSNLSTCWAPNLLKNEAETLQSMVLEANTVNSIISTIIENVEYMSVEKHSVPEAAVTLEEKEVKQAIDLLEMEQTPPMNRKATTEIAPKDGSMQGWLIKQGGSVKTWKRRWFEFEPKELVLFYYKNQRDVATKSHLGKIPILGYKLQAADEKDNVKKPFPFKLRHPGPCRTWFFSAASEVARQAWMETINNTVEVWIQSSALHTSYPKKMEEEVEDSDEDVEEEDIIDESKLSNDEAQLALEEAKVMEEEERMNQEELLVKQQEEELDRLEEMKAGAVEDQQAL